jgi:hypothetical protein
MKKILSLFTVLASPVIAQIPTGSVLFANIARIEFEVGVRHGIQDRPYRPFVYTPAELSALDEETKRYEEKLKTCLKMVARTHRAAAIKNVNEADGQMLYHDTQYDVTDQVIRAMKEHLDIAKLYDALRSDSSDELATLLNNGFEKNRIGKHHLWYAVQMERRDVIRYLVTQLNIPVDATLLTYAYKYQYGEAFRELAKSPTLDVHMIIDDRPYRYTLLDIAIGWNYPEMILMLIEKDPSITKDSMVQSLCDHTSIWLINALYKRNVTRAMAQEKGWDDTLLTPDTAQAIEILLSR